MALTYGNSAPEDRHGYGPENEENPSLKERLKTSMTVLKAVKMVLTTITALASVWALVQGIL
ncbi:hypothetical protein [Halococcus sp. PRR34]|uniref:hypothetical protein n=1 Tax=Halococcus sp. PRR34 TaxID=3020830 RepID=UPI0023624291|nr:hypothetical protein [Halococcus sp. PRR34]